MGEGLQSSERLQLPAQSIQESLLPHHTAHVTYWLPGPYEPFKFRFSETWRPCLLLE